MGAILKKRSVPIPRVTRIIHDARSGCRRVSRVDQLGRSAPPELSKGQRRTGAAGMFARMVQGYHPETHRRPALREARGAPRPNRELPAVDRAGRVAKSTARPIPRVMRDAVPGAAMRDAG